MTGALGVALLSMVINFTLGKAQYARYRRQLRDMLRKTEAMRRRLLRLGDEDCVAYASKNLKRSLAVPVSVSRLCYEAIQLCPELAAKGNRNLISDVAVGAALLEAAFMSACWNVDINLRMIADNELAQQIRKELSRYSRVVERAREETEAKIGKIIGR